MRRNTIVALLALGALLPLGCATGASGWPVGTEATLANPRGPRVVAFVPLDQRTKTGGRRWLALANNTRVVSLNDPSYSAALQNPGLVIPPTAPVVVRVAEGPHEGLSIVVERDQLDVILPDSDPTLVLVALMASIGIIAVLGCALEAWVARVRSRRHDQKFRKAFAGVPRTDQHHPSLAPGSDVNRQDDPEKWLGWLQRQRERTIERRGTPIR